MLNAGKATEVDSEHGALRNTPEGQLWTVVIVHSLKDLERAVQYKERARIEKLRWFFLDSDSVLTFVCEELDYSLRHIRQRANEILNQRRGSPSLGALPAVRSTGTSASAP